MKIITAISIIFLPAFLFATPPDCPKAIDTRQSNGHNIPGWEAFDLKQVHILRSVDYYDGHPQRMVQLKPDNGDTTENPTWTFSDKEQIWQVCQYTNTSIGLTKRLVKNPKNCTVKYSKEIKPQIDEINCNY